MILRGAYLPPGRAIIIMGVSGSGKSTIGSLLARSLGCPFLDADDFHSQKNKEKMKQGIPLTDSDRLPWLEALRDRMIDYILRGKTVVLACSALKPSYRQILRTADFQRMFETQSKHEEKHEDKCLPNGETKSSGDSEELYENRQSNVSPKSHSQFRRVKFLLLNGPADLFASRLKERFSEGTHFMPPSLLKSQFDSLKISENEDDIIYLDAKLSPAAIVEQARELLA